MAIKIHVRINRCRRCDIGTTSAKHGEPDHAILSDATLAVGGLGRRRPCALQEAEVGSRRLRKPSGIRPECTAVAETLLFQQSVASTEQGVWGRENDRRSLYQRKGVRTMPRWDGHAGACSNRSENAGSEADPRTSIGSLRTVFTTVSVRALRLARSQLVPLE
jgi:hypothetical protein